MYKMRFWLTVEESIMQKSALSSPVGPPEPGWGHVQGQTFIKILEILEDESKA